MLFLVFDISIYKILLLLNSQQNVLQEFMILFQARPVTWISGDKEISKTPFSEKTHIPTKQLNRLYSCAGSEKH